MNLHNENPPLNYAQQNALRYIFMHPNQNTQGITDALAGNNNHARYEVSNAVEYLVWQTPYVTRDNRTQAIRINEIGLRALESV